MIIVLIAWIALSIMVGAVARKTRMGFLRGFLFSLLLTPIVGLASLLIFSLVDSDEPKKLKAKLVSRVIRKA